MPPCFRIPGSLTKSIANLDREREREHSTRNSINHNITWRDLINETWVSKPLKQTKVIPDDEEPWRWRRTTMVMLMLMVIVMVMATVITLGARSAGQEVLVLPLPLLPPLLSPLLSLLLPTK